MVASGCINHSRDTNVIESIMSRIHVQAKCREDNKTDIFARVGITLGSRGSYRKLEVNSLTTICDPLSESDFDRLTKEVEEIDARVEREGLHVALYLISETIFMPNGAEIWLWHTKEESIGEAYCFPQSFMGNFRH